MEVIYADKNRRDIGYLLGCELDLAYGKDENDFSLTIELSEQCCEEGYFVYIEGTEYGGIIDVIHPDTDGSVIEYRGRTWHGIMEGKVLEPDKGQDHLIVSGDANDVLRNLVERMGLSGLFKVTEKTSGIRIPRYQFPRYVKGYTGIRKMLYSYRAKLSLMYLNKQVILSAIPLYDYSRDEEWDTSQLSFDVEKNFRPVNHLICLGKGDLKNRRVIHLFADENGEIQPYSRIQNPYMDSHYILDKSGQKLFYQDEKTEILDMGNAEIRENYIMQDAQPSRWSSVCAQYFVKDGDTYKPVEILEEEGYIKLDEVPNDWNDAYSNYYFLSDGEYKNVESIEEKGYVPLKTKPADWDTNYGDYYFQYSDGVTWEYRKVQGIPRERYILQKNTPTDWARNYKNYYHLEPVFLYVYEHRTCIGNNGVKNIWSAEYIESEKPLDEIRTENETLKLRRKLVKEYVYENVKGDTAPLWNADTYYVKETYYTPPEYVQDDYFVLKVWTLIPSFGSGTYYKKGTNKIIPPWKSGTYYRKYEDNYASLVEAGLEKMKEYADGDKLSSSLDSGYLYDVGDIVGAREAVTGIKVSQLVTKKIVNISKNIETITYEIGE